MARALNSKPFAIVASAAILAIAGVAATAAPADAQSRSRSRSVAVHGPNHSAVRDAQIYRSPGSAAVTRSGLIDGQSWSSSRNRSTVPTENGYATTATRTGPAGNTQSRYAETSCADGMCSRDASVQTSNGYGYARSVDAYHDEDGSTVNRSSATNSGATRSSTVNRPY
jgi:hypothetical protein